MVEESVVIPLKRIPAVQIGGKSANTSGHGTKPVDIDNGRVSAGESAQGVSAAAGLMALDARIVVDIFVVIAEADRVHERRCETVSFFDGDDLPAKKEYSSPTLPNESGELYGVLSNR